MMNDAEFTLVQRGLRARVADDLVARCRPWSGIGAFASPSSTRRR